MREFTEVTTVVLAATALLALMPTGAAHAQSAATRYVASTGSDFNTLCGRADPCQTFTHAIAETNPGGEVRCLDQLGQQAFPSTVTITQSVTIDCREVYGAAQRSVTPGSDTGFIINGVGINVTLRGLNISTIEPSSVAGRIGIDIEQAASVNIEDCTIRGFTSGAAQGIHIAPTSGLTTVSISDTVIANNGLGIRAFNGAVVSLLRVQLYNNSVGGFQVFGAGSASFASVMDSVANLNGGFGFSASSPAGGPDAVIDIQRSTAALNQQGGIFVDGAAAKVTIGASTVTANGTGFARSNGGVILSYGDNRVDNNTATGSTSGPAGQM